MLDAESMKHLHAVGSQAYNSEIRAKISRSLVEKSSNWVRFFKAKRALLIHGIVHEGFAV